jgi:uncharacterized protein (DUF1800 family)
MGRSFSRSHFLSILTESSYTGSGDKSDTPKEAGRAGLAPYRGEWEDTQLLHLLRRSLFGATLSDLKKMSGKNLDQCLDILLTQSPTPEPPVNVYNDEKYADPDVPYGKTWVYADFGDSEGPQDGRRVSSLKAWWVGLMINQDLSLTEKMTLFWSNHLAAQMYLMKDARLDYGYLALLRSSALGNFKKLVRDITTNPGMLEYLNTNVNTAKAPNENYSRELQELFTVGKGPNSHYTESDVREAARVLTGWETVDKPGGVFAVFNEQNHDTGDKHFSDFYEHATIAGKSGQHGSSEVDDLIDMIFRQKEVARYACRNIYRWFVYYQIDSEMESKVIEPLADVLIANDFEIKPVLRALLGSEHFYESRSMGCQIKNPIDHLIGAYRQLGSPLSGEDLKMQYESWSHLEWRLKEMGMSPGDPPNVAGWPATYQFPAYSESWISTTTLTMRNSATDILASPMGMNSPTFKLSFDLLGFARELSAPGDPDRLIADSCRILSSVPMGSKQTEILRDILLSGQTSGHYWADAWNEYLSNPEDPIKRNVALNRLTPFYTYILQRSEYQLT